jgi:hypothetical protein
VLGIIEALPKFALTHCYRTMIIVAAASMMIISAACAPTQLQVLTGAARAPIPASDVVVYSAAPAHFQQIALLTATRRTVFHVGGKKTIDQLMEQLAVRAAKLGANGIIVDELFDEQSMSLGTGVGSDTYTHNADISVGIGGLFGVYKKTGNARAIYVPRE